MSKKTIFKQCKLQRGNTFETAFIPDKFAKVGAYLKLKKVDGWKVIEVFSPRTGQEVNERSRDHLKTRNASDI